jgi:hypothetical protein
MPVLSWDMSPRASPARGLDLRVAHCCYEHADQRSAFLTEATGHPSSVGWRMERGTGQLAALGFTVTLAPAASPEVRAPLRSRRMLPRSG